MERCGEMAGKGKRMLIRMQGGMARNAAVRLQAPIDFELKEGEHVAVVGGNGSGKTLLVETLLGKYPLGEGTLEYDFGGDAPRSVYANVRHVAFRDSYGPADATYYYQQRWNACEMDEVPCVRDVLDMAGMQGNRVPDVLDIRPMANKKLVMLSSGELRRLQLAKALLPHPRVLVIDNPFIGLDAFARRSLGELLDVLARSGEIQMILVLSQLSDVPSFVTHVVPVSQGVCGKKVLRENFVRERKECPSFILPESKRMKVSALPCGEVQPPGEEVVRMEDVTIRYGGRTILDGLNWTVRRGEKWALRGRNGSGKSTLLSLVCADNPQSYACRITLFGQRRGTGESIWDIKRRIGYVSPEMHRGYRKNIPMADVVASGWFDTIGLHRRFTAEQREACGFWMDVFGILPLRERSFLQLSDGEQRLALLARAFVKDPELLVLDEPLHGLDAANCALVKEVIEAFAARPGKTLIMVTHYDRELPSSINHVLEL